MSNLENIYKLNRYFYMDSNQKIFKYKKYCVVYDCEKMLLLIIKIYKILFIEHKLEGMVNVKKLHADK